MFLNYCVKVWERALINSGALNLDSLDKVSLKVKGDVIQTWQLKN